MATKPAEKPTWNPTATNVTTPGAGQITSGWLPDDIPAPNTWNWLHYWAEQWITYFEDLTDASNEPRHVIALAGSGTGAGVFTAQGALDTAPTQSRLFPLTVNEGSTIVSIDARVFGSATENGRLSLRAYEDDVEIVAGGWPYQVSSALGAAWSTISVAVAEVATANRRFLFELEHLGVGGTNILFDHVAVDILLL